MQFGIMKLLLKKKPKKTTIGHNNPMTLGTTKRPKIMQT